MTVVRRLFKLGLLALVIGIVLVVLLYFVMNQ